MELPWDLLVFIPKAWNPLFTGIRLGVPLPGLPAEQGSALLLGRELTRRNHDGGAGTGSHEVGTMAATGTGALCRDWVLKGREL